MNRFDNAIYLGVVTGMSRGFDTMRAVLAIVASKNGSTRYGDFISIKDEAALKREIAGLKADGLIDSTIESQN